MNDPENTQPEKPEKDDAPVFDADFDFAALEDELLMIEENPNLEDHADAAESVMIEHDETPFIEDNAEPLTAQSYELKPVIEALLFVSEEPLPIKHLGKIMGDVAEIDIESALNELVA